jgi:hypothetical protein
MSDTTTTEDKAGSDRDDALRKSYANASKRLREENLDRFNALRVEEAKKLGVEWTPPKTEREKAQEKMAALLAEFPDLTPAQVPDTQIETPAAARGEVPDAVGGEAPSRI